MTIYKQFPTLETISKKVENDTARLSKETKELRDNPRYADNESERSYLLDKLADERETILSDAEAKYIRELEQIELNLVERTFAQPNASQEELNEAQAFVQQAKTQVLSALEPSSILSMLTIRAKTMSDVEKQLLAVELAEIESIANGKTRNQEEKSEVQRYIDEIKTAVADTKAAKSVSEQLESLQSIQKHNGSIRRSYDARDRALGVGR